jgi:hypothetical protein
MKIPFQTPIHLRTCMPKEQVVQRLGDVFSFRLWESINPWAGCRVAGRIKNERCRMRYRTCYNNSSQRELRLSIVAVDGGTALDGEFSVSNAVLAFSAFWLTIVLLFCVVSLYQLVEHRNVSGESPYWLLMPFGMLLFGAALFSFGLWLSRLTEPRVLEFLREEIGAEIVDGELVRLDRTSR